MHGGRQKKIEGTLFGKKKKGTQFGKKKKGTQFDDRVGVHGGRLIGPKLFRPEAYPTRQHCRLSICWYFYWVDKYKYKYKIQITILILRRGALSTTKTCCFLHRRSKAIKWLKQIRGGRKHSGFKLLFVGTSGLRLADTTWGFDNNLTMFFLYFDWLSLSFYIDQYFFHQVFVYLWIVVFGGFGAAGTFQPTWYQSCAGSGWKELLDKYLFEFSHSHFTFTFIHSLQSEGFCLTKLTLFRMSVFFSEVETNYTVVDWLSWRTHQKNYTEIWK